MLNSSVKFTFIHLAEAFNPKQVTLLQFFLEIEPMTLVLFRQDEQQKNYYYCH